MKNAVLYLLLLLPPALAMAQAPIRGTITDAATNQPVEGVTVRLAPAGTTVISDQLGNFIFHEVKGTPSGISFSSIGFRAKTVSMETLKKDGYQVTLSAQPVELANVTILPHAGEQNNTISRIDIALRGVTNSQEVLRIIPGVVIGQHQGGGKAEQLFLRGFDCDHGTDIRLEADGLPINMVSHAHGQGFADSHFIIPETISNVDPGKGPYAAGKGDFSTSGYAVFNTRNSLPDNMVKMEGGMFNTWRGLAMFNLLREKAKLRQQSWYIASEYRYSDAYFDHPQHFNRLNLFTKYNGKLSGHNFLSVSAAAFWSKWDASGQIPERAVADGSIGFYGALDPNEGGVTYRTNINVQLLTLLGNGDMVKNQFYFSDYHFDLHSNFTFFLVDTVNGDEIRQREGRHLMGYNGSFQHSGSAGDVRLTTEGGLQLRLDRTDNSSLSHTLHRYITLRQIKLGDIGELSVSPYISETIVFSPKFTLNAALRFDQFYHRYTNKLAADPAFPGMGVFRASAHTFSPKVNLYYQAGKDLQVYLAMARGFHSNDTRAVVVRHGGQILPGAYGVDLGVVFKPVSNILINAAIWQMYLEQEFVYGGDGGSVAFNGKTRRYGLDVSGRYEPVRSLYIDLDLNYAHGRAIDAEKGKGYIPLAPVWTSSAGISYSAGKGFSGSLRYRYLADRPANDDYSLTAAGYFVTDAVLSFTRGNYEIGLVVNNVFNTKWKETQFDTRTRLRGEAAPADGICFTAGTPVAARMSFSIRL
jgi:hypothetical protein